MPSVVGRVADRVELLAARHGRVVDLTLDDAAQLGDAALRPRAAQDLAGGHWALRLRGLPLGVLVAAGSLVVVLVGLLLPWLSASALYVLSVSEDGFNGWGWLSVVALLGGVAIVLAKALRPGGAGYGSARTLGDTQAGRLLMVAGGAGLLGVVLFWATAPSGSRGLQVHVGAGLVVALLGFLGLIGGGALVGSVELTSRLRARLRGPGSP